MSDPSLELQKAMVSVLKADNVAEGRIYDQAPQNAVFPYVTLGDGQVLPDKAGCIDGAEIFPQVDVWSRATGYPETKTIVKTILAALDDKPPPMDGYAAVIFELENIQYLRDPDGITRHAAITFHTRIQ